MPVNEVRPVRRGRGSAPPGGSRRRGRQGVAPVAPWVAALAVLALAGCDVPTGAPKWDTTWMVPARSVSFGVDQFLPSSVSVTPDSSAFQLRLAGLPFAETLGALCGAPCYAANGQTVPKPAFSGTLSRSLALPADLQSATLASTPATLLLTNGLSFDPIRPSASARGSIVVTFLSGGAILGSTTINGADAAFPPGQTLTRSVSLSGTASGSVTVRVDFNSPAGDPARVQVSDSVSFDVQNIRLASVTANVGTQSISQSEPLGLGSIDPVVLDHLLSGTLKLNIDNPYPVSGKLDLVIGGPSTAPIARPVTLTPGTSSVSLDFTAAELRSFLGQPGVTLTVKGNVTASGPVTFLPGQTATVDSRLEAVLGPQGG